MDKLLALEALSALAHETRLDVFRSLIQAGPEGIPAGEIAEAHDVRQNTMSSHLSILRRAGLIGKERIGRSIRYSANFDAMRDLLLYLLEDCCRGDTQICAPIVEALACNC
ncbi:MAG: metalloregulator ArsR/SmtB family transcription factor [Pseudomonadota bacterium]